MIEYKDAKKILLTNKQPEAWFNTMYTMNIYRGCQHGCIYCDSRSSCYQIKNFDKDIIIKKNAIELLKKELQGKKRKGIIGTGSMSDPYMPIEKKECLTRESLKLIKYYGFPVHINTKSNLVLRDLDLLKDINSNTFAEVAVTVTTVNDDLAKIIEPRAPLPSKRLEAIRQLSDQGIYVGILLMPILPFINDSKKQILQLAHSCIESGAKFIYPLLGMSLREGQREFYYDHLEQHFPGLKNQYMNTYGQRYNCSIPNKKAIYTELISYCYERGVPTRMRDFKTYKPITHDQISLGL